MVHEKHIRRCLELAQTARGKTGINPMVGAVLVRDGKIIAEAFHEGFGLPHAERALLERFKGVIMPEDVLYVNLEPCCHFGKTPPCTDIILKKGIKRLVFGMLDPNPRVSGKGINKIRNNGILVIGPIMPELCGRFNRGFVSLQTSGRPYITLKRAQTKAGKFKNKDGSPLKITSREQDEWAHSHLRARHDAILTGAGTIISDDPLLTVRYGDKDFQPFRIVLDPDLRIPPSARVLNDEYANKTIIFTKPSIPSQPSVIIHIRTDGNHFDWDELWSALITPRGDFHGIMSILVEGGEKTWRIFKEAGVVDEEVVLIGEE